MVINAYVIDALLVLDFRTTVITESKNYGLLIFDIKSFKSSLKELAISLLSTKTNDNKKNETLYRSAYIRCYGYRVQSQISTKIQNTLRDLDENQYSPNAYHG